MNYSTSKQLIHNVKHFMEIKHYNSISKFLNKKGTFYGWGRKKSGLRAVELAKKHNTSYVLLEDGFIRSLGLGAKGSPSFSLIEDDVGIYYDATQPSKLENILNSYDFRSDTNLMQNAKEAITFIKTHHISKYNNAPDIEDDFFKDDAGPKVLIIAQTAGDASLEYGMVDDYTTQDMVNAALDENPKSTVYLKVHPDVLSGKKESDIDLESLDSRIKIITQNANPISLLKHFEKVYTKTSGMGFEALLVGGECVCFGMPFYAGWGITDDRSRCKRRKRVLSIEEVFAAAYILYIRYHNPYTHKPSDIFDTIKSIVKYRDVNKQNNGKLFFFGFSLWKRKNTALFFPPLQENTIHFCSTLEDALRKGMDEESKIYIWGMKPFPELEQYAREHGIDINRVEDGFVRSFSLGSDLTKAYSVVVDSRGIYFDPRQESDLEHILNTADFDEELLERSRALQRYLVENRISKYNIHRDKSLSLLGFREGQRVALVPGQVEDDASIIYGADGMSNLELLQRARENAPEAYIIYKPHPDVLAGNRKGHIPPDEALRYADTIITDTSLDSVLEVSDEVHTMTSLVGFEALIRGKRVYTYGLPFYAGWGLTIDAKSCPRRTTRRSLDELVTAALILYPRYLHPKTNRLCEIEALLEAIEQEKTRYNTDKVFRYRVNIRNFISRKVQLLLRVILGQ